MVISHDIHLHRKIFIYNNYFYPKNYINDYLQLNYSIKLLILFLYDH